MQNNSHGQQHSHLDRTDYDHEYEQSSIILSNTHGCNQTCQDAAAVNQQGDLNPAHPSVQQQHGHETFGYGSPLSYPSRVPQGTQLGPRAMSRVQTILGQQAPLQHQSSSSTRGRNGMRPPGYDSKMGPPGFPAAPQSNGWVLRHQAVPLPQSSMMMA